MAKLPPGCTFEPSDEELIDYLHRKVTGCKPLPSPCLVKECDLYGNMHPEQIWEQFKDSASGKKRVDLYVFTILKEKKKETNCITTLKKKKKMNYFNRTNEKGGTWSNEGSVVVYTTDTKQPIGIMRQFSYSNPSNPQQNGCWVLHEYSLDINGSVLLPPSSSKHVLCRLRMKGKNENISNSRKRKSPALSQPQPQPQHSHTDAVVHSNCNLKQPLRQAPNSEHEQGGEPSVDDIVNFGGEPSVILYFGGEPSMDDIFKEVEDAGRGEQGETENVYEIPNVEGFNELHPASPDLFGTHPSTLPGSSQNYSCWK